MKSYITDPNHPSLRYGLGFWGFFKKCVGMYANANGRATVAEYWSFVACEYLILITVMVVTGVSIAVIGGLLGVNSEGVANVATIGAFVPATIVILGLVVPSVCVTIRRLHDIGLTGWIYLIGFIPYIGGLVLFVMTVLPSSKTANMHGPNPADVLAGRAVVEAAK